MTIEYYNLKSHSPKGYPVRHRRKAPFNPSIVAPADLHGRSRLIKMLDIDLDRYILAADDYTELVVDAYSSNVHWSSKLEGNPLSEREVRKITMDSFTGTGREKATGPRQEIINHLMRLTSPEEFSLPWNHERILALHRYLMTGTGSRTRIGSYRECQTCIRDSSGAEVFIPAPPGAIEDEMLSLLEWVNTRASAYDSIVAATVFFHEFESIHPFEDGNGRAGRCLFHLFLQNSDLQNSHLCKIERQLLKDNEMYYQMLAYADDSGSYTELIDFVSDAMLKSYEGAHRSLSAKDLLSSGLDEVSKRLLKMAKANRRWFSLAEAQTWVSSVGMQTVRNRLNELVEIGALQKEGRTRACRFRMKSQLSEFRANLEPRAPPSKPRDH